MCNSKNQFEGTENNYTETPYNQCMDREIFT